MTWRTGSLSLASLAVMGLVLTGSARAQPSQALIEARRHMLNAEINTLTFRSMEQLFDTLRVASDGEPWRLDEQPAPLDFAYTFGGETRPAEAFLERTYTNALLILKNDRIVFERYLNNTREDDHFISMSVAKSITSILIGMAIDDGLIESVDDPIVRYLPELAGTGYDGVTIRQALLMRSGVDWNERYDFGRESPMQRLHDGAVVENRFRFVEPALGLGRLHPPGEVFNYSTVETAVLGWVLERAAGRPLPEYMEERWWKPAGMQSYGFWIADGPPGVGRAINGMGFNASLRDYARIGLMMLHNGEANGRRLLSSAWVAESTIPAGTEPAAPGARRGYQYHWWTLTDSDAYMAVGLQGQYIYVDPATRTVVVKLSHFPPGEPRADAETEAFLRAVSQWTPRPPAAEQEAALPAPSHPMDALTADEIRKAVEVLMEPSAGDGPVQTGNPPLPGPSSATPAPQMLTLLQTHGAGVALRPGAMEHGTVRVQGNRGTADDAVPSVVVAAEQYNMLVRLDQAGIPAFTAIKDFRSYDVRTRHTNADLADAVNVGDLQQSAVVLAAIAWHAAVRDEPIPRRQR